MPKTYFLITPAVRSLIARRAEELRMLRHEEQPKSPTFEQDAETLKLDLSRIPHFTGRMRHKKHPVKQVVHLEDEDLVLIQLDKPALYTPKLEDYVRYARNRLGDVLPADFEYAHHIVELFDG